MVVFGGIYPLLCRGAWLGVAHRQGLFLFLCFSGVCMHALGACDGKSVLYILCSTFFDRRDKAGMFKLSSFKSVCSPYNIVSRESLRGTVVA